MTPVNSAPPKPQAARPPAQPTRPAPPEDVTAMRSALARARQGHVQEQPLASGQRGARGKTVQQAQAPAAGALRAMTMPEDRRWGAERESSDRQGPQQGIGATAGGVPPVPVQAVAVPPPTVDPSAFAQLMTQLWSRENQRGAKEVRVQLGSASWPATGARLVRNAAGALDIAIEFGTPPTADQGALDALRHHFAKQGVAIGALSVEEA